MAMGHMLRNLGRLFTIKTRLEVYQRDTAPLVAHYAQRGIMRRVPGTGTIEQIAEEIKRIIGR